MSGNTKRIALLAAVLMACVCGCSLLAARETQSGGSRDDNEMGEIIMPIEAEFPHRDAISSTLPTTAHVEAEDFADVTSEGVAKCIDILVDEGDYVRRGQILAELDKKEAQASLHQTKAQVSQQKIAYERAKESLYQGLISASEYDNAKSAYEQGEAGLELQQIQVDNLTIRAPISGLITKKDIQVGKLVSTGSPIFHIVDPHTFMICIHVDEKEIGRLKKGQIARVAIDSLPGEEFTAEVTKIYPNVEEGQIRVKLEFDKDTRSRLKDAAYARVDLVLDTREDALLVPKDTVIEENARKYVFVVDDLDADFTVPAPETADVSASASAEEPADASPDGDVDKAVTAASEEDAQDVAQEEPAPALDVMAPEDSPRGVAKRVEVETGYEDANFIELISGVTDTDLIVTLGQQTLKPGADVKLTNVTRELQTQIAMSAEDALAAAEEERAKGAKPRMPAGPH